MNMFFRAIPLHCINDAADFPEIKIIAAHMWDSGDIILNYPRAKNNISVDNPQFFQLSKSICLR
jgi:hypothetical protein